jgi:hypothetical protein
LAQRPTTHLPVSSGPKKFLVPSVLGVKSPRVTFIVGGVVVPKEKVRGGGSCKEGENTHRAVFAVFFAVFLYFVFTVSLLFLFIAFFLQLFAVFAVFLQFFARNTLHGSFCAVLCSFFFQFFW